MCVTESMCMHCCIMLLFVYALLQRMCVIKRLDDDSTLDKNI